MYKLVAVLMLCGLQVGYLLGSLAPLEYAFRVKELWARDHGGLSLLLGASGIIGLALGSLVFGLGFIRKRGRRWVIVVGCCVGIIGILI